MDIDQEGSVLEPEDGPEQQVALPTEVLPAVIPIVPQERPFFPGQAIPLVLDEAEWRGPLETMQKQGRNTLGLVALRPDSDNQDMTDRLYDVGTICRIHRILSQDGQLQVLVEGIQRFRITSWAHKTHPLAASVHYLSNRPDDDSDDTKAYALAVINMIKELIPLNPLYGEELKIFLTRSNPNQPSLLADFAASLTSATPDDLQEVLTTVALQPRLEKVVELLHKELQVAKAQKEIRENVEREIQTHQREAILKQQLKYIQSELGITKDDKTAEIDEFKARLKDLTLPEHAQTRADEELRKLALLETGSPEYAVTRNYLDWLTSVPWGKYSDDNHDLKRAAKTLDRHHEGLKDVKERVLEFLAVGMTRGDVGGSIICFVGPPGVGKTSLGRAIAESLQRSFYRFSVGGMRDEAEIKGHRRTYIGALPGKLIQALKDTGVSNPVIMLDEIDKIGASYQGDPASALLEVLDPEQNDRFHDHYLDLNVDLSKVLFICTANQLDTIPGPLLDRMEVIRLSGYLADEKLAIASRHLLPRQLKRAGLTGRDVKISRPALRKVIDEYAREAGVRRLDKALASLVRKAAVALLDGTEPPLRFGPDDVVDALGPPLHTAEQSLHGTGIVTGLAWTPLGGATLPVEVSKVHESNTGMNLTGQLGDVMRESASIAWSYVRSHADALGAPEGFFEKAFVHVHVPAGATPKDGPSAGTTIAAALLSLALGKAPKRGFAMTGELTLTGRVYPVGGIREKLLAAKRQRVKHVILPAENERDYLQIPEAVRKGVTVHFVDRFEQVAELLFGSG